MKACGAKGSRGITRNQSFGIARFCPRLASDLQVQHGQSLELNEERHRCDANRRVMAELGARARPDGCCRRRCTRAHAEAALDAGFEPGARRPHPTGLP